MYQDAQCGRSKTWLYRYRLDDKARKFTLGSNPAMSLVVARAEYGKSVAMVKVGEDPAAAARAAKVKRSAMPTFDAFLKSG